jgi:hypothetical protein
MRSQGLRTLVGRGLFGPLVLGAAGLLTLFGYSRAAIAAPKTDPVNLTQFIGPDFFAAVVVHPSRLAKAPIFAALAASDMSKTITSGPPEAALAAEFFKAEKIRRVVLMAASTAEEGIGPSHATVGVIIQFNEDADSDAFLKQVAKDAEPATQGDATYLMSKALASLLYPTGGPGVRLAAYVAGPRTLLIGLEPAMKKMLAPVTGPRPLLEQLKHSSLNNDLLIQVAAEQLLKSDAGAALKAMTQAQPKQLGIDLDDVKSIAIALNVTQEPLLKLAVTGAKPDSADKFSGLMQLAKMGLTAALENAKKNPSPMLPPEIKEPLFKVADEIVASLKVAKEGDEVALTIAQPATLPALVQKVPDLIKTLGPMLVPGGPGNSAIPGKPAVTPPANADPFSPNAGPAAKPPAANADPFAPPPATPEPPPSPAPPVKKGPGSLVPKK